MIAHAQIPSRKIPSEKKKCTKRTSSKKNFSLREKEEGVGDVKRLLDCDGIVCHHGNTGTQVREKQTFAIMLRQSWRKRHLINLPPPPKNGPF